MRREPRVRVWTPLAVSVAMFALAGCGSQGAGVTVPLGADELDSCRPQQIRVEDLAARGQPGCNLAGSTLLFTDGTAVTVQPVGSVFVHRGGIAGSREYQVVNWGVPGVGVAAVEGGGLVDLWASGDEAERLQREQLRVDGIVTDEVRSDLRCPRERDAG